MWPKKMRKKNQIFPFLTHRQAGQRDILQWPMCVQKGKEKVWIKIKVN